MRRLTLLHACALAACAGTTDTPPEPSVSGGSVDPAVARACPDAPTLTASGATECTEIGCNDDFEIEVTPDAAWPAGKYRYVLELDGRTVTCAGTLPLRDCGSPSMQCDDDGVSIVESGCALDPELHAFGGVSLPELPSRVHLRIEHDGTALVDTDLDVEYTASQPNGPGCGPVCCQGRDTVSLSFES